MTSTAIAQGVCSVQQSKILLRNIMRLTYSSVLWSRGSFPDESFEDKRVHGMQIKALGGDGCEGHAKTLLTWLERGVFEALSAGYLEKCILIMSADEAASQVLEAWSLSIAWLTDEEGNELPTITCAGPRAERSHRLRKPTSIDGKYTLDYARSTSKAMLRQLSLMLQTLPSLPETHWISMRVLYRDDVTPRDYEPFGFERAGDDNKLRFCTRVRTARGAARFLARSKPPCTLLHLAR